MPVTSVHFIGREMTKRLVIVFSLLDMLLMGAALVGSTQYARVGAMTNSQELLAGTIASLTELPESVADLRRSVRIDLTKLRALSGAEVSDLARRALGE